MNKTLDDFSNIDVSDLKMPLISIFYDTKDIPGKYAARMFDLDQPTDVVVIKDTLKEIRNVIPKGLTCIPRQPNDHPTVIEVWV